MKKNMVKKFTLALSTFLFFTLHTMEVEEEKKEEHASKAPLTLPLLFKALLRPDLVKEPPSQEEVEKLSDTVSQLLDVSVKKAIKTEALETVPLLIDLGADPKIALHSVFKMLVRDESYKDYSEEEDPNKIKSFIPKENFDTLIQDLINSGIGIDKKDKNTNKLVLIYAVEHDLKDLAELLLKNGVNIHEDALGQAICKKNIEMAKLLLEYNATIEKKHFSLDFKKADGKFFQLLIDKADPSVLQKINPYCLIKHAALAGKLDMVKKILKKTVYVGRILSRSRFKVEELTLLHYAAAHNLADFAALLLQYNASSIAVELNDTRKISPIDIAQIREHVVSTVLELCDSKSFIEFRKNIEFKKNPVKFIEDQKDAKKPTPPQLLLLWSIILDREDIFDALLQIPKEAEEVTFEEKMDIEDSLDLANAKDAHGMTALMYAALLGNENMCRKLVHAGAKINLQNEWGKTAIQLAADAGYWNIASLLLMKLKGKNLF